MCKEKYAKAINKAIFPGTQGGPLMHIIAAKAICFGEALKPEFKEYQQQVIKNAKALAQAMIDEGFNLVSGGTDNHLMLVDLQNMNITGKELQNRLDEVYITVNKNGIQNLLPQAKRRSKTLCRYKRLAKGTAGAGHQPRKVQNCQFEKAILRFSRLQAKSCGKRRQEQRHSKVRGRIAHER